MSWIERWNSIMKRTEHPDGSVSVVIPGSWFPPEQRRYRCPVCGKSFKGTKEGYPNQWWWKHYQTKHPEEFEKFWNDTEDL